MCDLDDVFKYLDATKTGSCDNKLDGIVAESGEHDLQEGPRSPRMLNPEHPLLERFQNALKNHLESQLEQIGEEVFELETGIKKTTAKRDQKGLETYEVQQSVSKQQEGLESLIKQLGELNSVQEKSEVELEETLTIYKDGMYQLDAEEKKELELRSEVEMLNAMLKQVSAWEHDIEHELMVHQRISEKTRKDKLKLSDEKRTQDMFVYKLQAEVWKLENELETMMMQLRVKEEERETLAQSVAAANIEIEANESEHKCLIHGWQSVIAAIQKRDKEYNERQNELYDIHEKIRSTQNEIEKVKKLCRKEMQQNETFTMFKLRVETDLKNSANQLNIEVGKLNILERQIAKTQTMIDGIEEDITRVSSENAAKTHAVGILTRDFEILMAQRILLEEEIMAKLQDQFTNDKASRYMHKLARSSKDTNTKMEISLANLENNNAKILMEIESQKYLNESANRTRAELMHQQQLIESEVGGYIDEARKADLESSKLLRSIESLQKKLDVTILKTGGVQISPNELKIKVMEKNIEDALEVTKELQRFWLREQGHVVQLCQQRQTQIKETNIIRKQIMILDQKNLKVSDDLESHKKKESELNRIIYGLQNRLTMFTKALDKKRTDKNVIDKDNVIKQINYTAKLEELELETITLQSRILEMEDEKETLSRELIEKNREVLEWEKRLKMVMETKQTIKDEISENGEIGNMRAEIHRMEVRFSQLKKAQDKMIHDLEHCVSRRDGIVTNAVAREKRRGGDSILTRFHYNKRIDDMKNKLKLAEKEIENHTKKLEITETEKNSYEREVQRLKSEIEHIISSMSEIEESNEYLKTDKLFNLDILLLKQRKLQVYMELQKGRSPFLQFKTDSDLNAEYKRMKNINDKLLNVVENLLTDFPNHSHTLTRINNCLKLPILYI